MQDAYFILYGLLALGVIVYGLIKYKTLLNPLSITATMLSIAVLIALPRYYWFPSVRDPLIIGYTVFLSAIYLMGFCSPFAFKTPNVYKLYAAAFRYLKLDSSQRVPLRRRVAIYAPLIISFIFFLMLAILGGGGILWILEPRDAYMDYRRGVGLYYALTQWSVVFFFIFYLWLRRPLRFEGHSLLLAVLTLSYFLGSKGFLINFVIIYVFYRHYKVRPIGTLSIVLFGGLVVSGFLGIQILQGTAQNLAGVIKYFSYFDSSVRFLERFGDIGFQYGAVMFSQLWDYVPRALYPEKPIVYGYYLVHETLNPGMLAKGRAEGTLVWLRYYMDFGVFGVFLFGLFRGIIAKIAYIYFLNQKENPFAFMAMMQFGIVEIFNYSTTGVFVALLLIAGTWLRSSGAFKLKWLHTKV